MANFSGACLDGATFVRASMEKALFKDASLKKAVLIGAQLAYANFSRAIVTGSADFSAADMSVAKI